jgi:BlaI family transcriptional regulator, penicillinase repressor
MSRQATITLTPREAEIMHVLWEGGPAPAETIRAALADGTHDSSVRTILRILEQKGYVAHETEGKAYIYFARVLQDRAQTTAMRDLVGRFFGGSAKALIVRLMEDRELTAEQLAEIAALAQSAGEGRKETSPCFRSEVEEPSGFDRPMNGPVAANPVHGSAGDTQGQSHSQNDKKRSSP